MQREQNNGGEQWNGRGREGRHSTAAASRNGFLGSIGDLDLRLRCCRCRRAVCWSARCRRCCSCCSRRGRCSRLLACANRVDALGCSCTCTRARRTSSGVGLLVVRMIVAPTATLLGVVVHRIGRRPHRLLQGHFGFVGGQKRSVERVAPANKTNNRKRNRRKYIRLVACIE